MNHRTWQVYGIGALLLGLLLTMAIPFFAERIPEKLEATARQQFQQQRMPWVQLDVQERDLTLSGNAPNPLAYQQALQTAQSVRGVRHVINHMTPRIISPYTLTIDWNNQQLVVEGFLPDETSYQAMSKQVAKLYGKDQTLGKLQLANGNPAGWNDLLDTLLTQTQQLERAHIDITDQNVSVSGKTSTTTLREQFSQALEPFKQQGYVMNLHLVAGDSAAQACQQKFNELLQTPLLFESGGTRIHQDSQALLNKLAETATLCPKANITVAGHTDNQGSHTTNLKLSEQRALTVASWLFQEGIETSRINAIGYGSSHPVADNTTEAGRTKNRRIEFVVQGN
jgi:outer membrane protein OmpA-like peptidoglycan-associated protein